jgi:hypothetical protein
MTDAGTPDVTLKLTVPATAAIHAGVKISFQGRADSFTKDPFALVIVADAAQVVTDNK